jgi:hypothetical protein
MEVSAVGSHSLCIGCFNENSSKRSGEANVDPYALSDAVSTSGVPEVAKLRKVNAHLLANNFSDPPSAKPSRIAVDETAVKVNGGWS